MSAVSVPLFTENVPQDLKALPQWVCWRYQTRDGKRTKVPVDAKTGALASSTDPNTWSTFGEATIALEWGHHDGVGFVFTEADPFFMIDLDGARDMDVNAEWAAAIVDRFPIYWEVSPSGQGLRGIGRGTLPVGGNRKGKIELYDKARFSTVTGNTLDYAEIGEDVTDTLTRFHRELFEPVIAVGTPVHTNPPTPPFTDDELLERAFAAKNGDKLRTLLSGDTSGYDSQSEAELAAVGILKFWTQDAEQIERILRLSSLQRDKWDKNKSYVDRTIAAALSQPGPTYEPPNNVIDFRKHLGQGEGGGNGNSGAGDPPSSDDAVPGFRLSDLGNGQRLAARIAGKALYCFPAKRWYVYRKGAWLPDDIGWLLSEAKKSVLAMYDAVSVLPDKERTALLKHALKSESERALKAAIGLATDELPVLPDAFDQDRMLLNVVNGTLDLRMGALRPHDPTDLLSKIAPVNFDPEAACPRWLAFLDQIFEGDQTRIDFVQKALGYCLTGDTSERVVFIAYGSGRNGKTTLSRLIMSILGDYAKRTPTETIMAKKHESGIPNHDLAPLVGVRFATVSETEEGRKLNVAKVKDMAGDEVMTARFLYQEEFNFRPQFKLWVSTNHKPIIPGNDQAIFDRFRMIPFTYRIPEDQIDKTLEAQLAAEKSGILNWLIAGCLRWQKEGLRPPKEVTEATDTYRQEMDQIGNFLDEMCVEGAGYSVASGTLYAVYKKWCETNSEQPISGVWFGRNITERGFEVVRTGKSNVRTIKNLGLAGENTGRQMDMMPPENEAGDRYSPAKMDITTESDDSDPKNTGRHDDRRPVKNPANTQGRPVATGIAGDFSLEPSSRKDSKEITVAAENTGRHSKSSEGDDGWV
jgi:putative DNA primase/helicase